MVVLCFTSEKQKAAGRRGLRRMTDGPGRVFWTSPRRKAITRRRRHTPLKYVTSLNRPDRRSTNGKNAAQKQADPQAGVRSQRGMHGCGHQVAVDLWNARGKDVAATSQLGCPATAVVPRVSGSGKPPMNLYKIVVPNLQPLPPQ